MLTVEDWAEIAHVLATTPVDFSRFAQAWRYGGGRDLEGLIERARTDAVEHDGPADRDSMSLLAACGTGPRANIGDLLAPRVGYISPGAPRDAFRDASGRGIGDLQRQKTNRYGLIHA